MLCCRVCAVESFDVQLHRVTQLLIQLADLDTRINESWPEFESDLKAAMVKYTMHMYPKCNHGFHNDSTARYDEANAKLAWERTLAFFKQHLGQA